jgi:hypothetical protein
MDSHLEFNFPWVLAVKTGSKRGLTRKCNTGDKEKPGRGRFSGWKRDEKGMNLVSRIDFDTDFKDSNSN